MRSGWWVWRDSILVKLTGLIVLKVIGAARFRYGMG